MDLSAFVHLCILRLSLVLADEKDLIIICGLQMRKLRI